MTRILLAGCGKMGGALLSGWLARGVRPMDVWVVEPGALSPPPGVRITSTVEQIASDFIPDVVILAVKPQVMGTVAPLYAKYHPAIFLSIAAGKPLAFFASLLGSKCAIVRAMPNTPAAVQAGITVCVANENVPDAGRQLCQTLLEAVGEVAWIADETLMDAVTAVSGSGPAYVFLLAETLAAAGEAAGLPADLSARLARATVIGAGKLLGGSEQSSEQLRVNVTSPGGTTAAALGVLMEEPGGMTALMKRAVVAATRRGRELA